MKTARLFSFLGVVALVLLALRPAYAADMLKGTKVIMTDPRPSTSTMHTFAFTTNTAGIYRAVQVEYCTNPSGGCTKPTGMSLLSVSGGALVGTAGIIDGNWTLANTSTDVNWLRFERTVTGQSVNTNEVVSFTVQGITNPAIGNCHASTNSSTDTCYVAINAYSDVGRTTTVDSATASITVAAAVTVTARVDPLFTFVVDGVGAGTVNNGVTTSVASTYSSLPFGNLTANVAKYAAHQLNVTTNTQSGYTVSVKMVTQMTGVYGTNNIDPFIGQLADPASDGTPKAWSGPYGNASNTNTGWIGMNLTDNDVSGWSGSDEGLFSPVASSAEYIVMKKTSSDNGTTADFVSYGLQANVYQPADTYTGILFYNALPTY